MKKILAFSGSNSSQSINQQWVSLVASKVKNSEVTVIDLRDYPLPIYSIDIEKGEGIPQAASDLKKVLDSYDGFIIALPEHNSSLTAFFKNTMDWVSRIHMNFFEQRPLLLLSTSPGRGGGRSALEHGAKLLSGYLKGQIVGKHSLPSFHQHVDLTENGARFQNPEEEALIDELLAKLEIAVTAEKVIQQ